MPTQSTPQPPTLAEAMRRAQAGSLHAIVKSVTSFRATRPVAKEWTSRKGTSVGALPVVLTVAGWIVFSISIVAGVMTLNLILPVAGVIGCVTFCSMGSIIRSIRNTEADAANALALTKYLADLADMEEIEK